MLTQNVWLSIIGAFLGWPLGYLLLSFMGSTMASDMDMMSIIAPLSLLIGIGGSFTLSVILSYFFSGYVNRLDMVMSLKSVE